MGLLFSVFLWASAVLGQIQKSPPANAPKVLVAQAPSCSTESLQELTSAIRDNKPNDYINVLRELKDAILQPKPERPWWSDPTLVATWLNVLLLGVTAWLTLKMREAAQAQADAALDMLKEAKTQTLLDSRPILIPCKEWETANRQTFGASNVILNVQLRNIGRGPAFNIKTSAQINLDSDLNPSKIATVAVLEQTQYTDISISIEHLVPDCTTFLQLSERLKEKPTEKLCLVIQYEDLLQTTWRSNIAIDSPHGGGKFRFKFVKTELEGLSRN